MHMHMQPETRSLPRFAVAPPPLQDAPQYDVLAPGLDARLRQQRLQLYQRQAHWCASSFVHLAARKVWASCKVRTGTGRHRA